MTFDTTIHLTDVALVGGLLLTVVKLIIAQRDTNTKILGMLGAKNPREGLLGDVETLKDESREARDWRLLHGGKKV